jgi:hypothetical protein
VVSDLPGIDAVDAGWKKRLEDRTTPREPLAALVPEDNYFLRFRDISKFLTFVELIEDWARRAAPDYELKRVIARYETQLGLSHRGDRRRSAIRWRFAALPSPAAIRISAKARTSRSSSIPSTSASSPSASTFCSPPHGLASALNSRRRRRSITTR